MEKIDIKQASSLKEKLDIFSHNLLVEADAHEELDLENEGQKHYTAQLLRIIAKKLKEL